MASAEAAATAVPLDQLETLVVCSICLETLREPRTLPCHHNFCKLCLTKFVQGHRKKAAGKKLEIFNCPDCRAEFSLKTNEEVEGMGSSHFIRNMLEVLTIQRQAKEKTIKCSRCQGAAISRCSDCEVFMCEKCYQAHETWHGEKKHSVLSLSELSKPENQAKLKPKAHCQKHKNKTMKFFCETCQQLICRYCMDFEHARPDHQSRPLTEVAEKEREALGSHCQVLQQHLNNGQEALKSYSEIQQSIKNNAEKAKEEIRGHKEEILKTVAKMVEEKAQRLMNEVDAKSKEVSEAIAQQEAEVKDYVEKVVKGPLQLAKNVYENGNDEEILSTQKLVKENVEKLKKNRLSNPKAMKPSHDGHIGYGEKINEAELNDYIEKKLTEKFGNIECHPVKVYGGFVKVCKASSILDNQPAEYAEKLHEWLDDQFQWRCCYRASRDGWRAEDFHKRCDGVGPTVTLVKVGDYICGGYTDQDWAGNRVYKSSQTSFLFSLRNKDCLGPFKAPSKPDGRQCAIISRPSYGPAFGGGHDLFISDNSTANNISYSSGFGHSYQLPAGYVYGSDSTGSLLTGSPNFTPCEVEVFH